MIQNIWLHLKKLYLLEQQQQKHPAKRHMQNKQTNGYTIAPTKEPLMLLALTHASSQQSQQQQLSLLLEEQQLQDETGQLESPDKQQVHLDVLQIYQPEMNDHPIAYEIMANIRMEPGIILNLLSLVKYSPSIMEIFYELQQKQDPKEPQNINVQQNALGYVFSVKQIVNQQLLGHGQEGKIKYIQFMIYVCWIYCIDISEVDSLKQQQIYYLKQLFVKKRKKRLIIPQHNYFLFIDYKLSINYQLQIINQFLIELMELLRQQLSFQHILVYRSFENNYYSNNSHNLFQQLYCQDKQYLNRMSIQRFFYKNFEVIIVQIILFVILSFEIYQHPILDELEVIIQYIEQHVSQKLKHKEKTKKNFISSYFQITVVQFIYQINVKKYGQWKIIKQSNNFKTIIFNIIDTHMILNISHKQIFFKFKRMIRCRFE
ncbi:hypothetical protein pb186bvf_007880 [Paramecium bursaria]